MSDTNPSREDLLLELHLGTLEEPQRSWIETELIRDAELRVKSDRLRGMLRPLDFAGTPPVPTGLVDRVLDAVHKADAESAQRKSRPWLRRSHGGGTFVLRRDFLAAAASIVLLASVAWPSLLAVRNQSRQMVCMSNLGSVFQGVRIYQASFADALPYAGPGAGAAWLGECGDTPVASNSRHLYLVAKLNYVPDPAQFVCPSMPGGSAMSKEKLTSLNDFAAARNISYDSLNLSGVSPNLRPARNVAYLGDANPLFVGGKFHRDIDPYTTNSPAHHGRGQAVLMLDGSVNKLTTPVVGQDNVWIAGDIRDYKGTEIPADENDSFLVPGCPENGAAAARHTH